MNDALVVLLGDRVAGTLTRLTGGQLRFDYDPLYREAETATPLSLSMPVRINSHSDRVVTPWLWGLLPDNEAVLRRWARELQASASSAFSLLSTPVGEDCAGAVRFVAPDRVEEALGRSGEVTWLDESGVAERLRELREDATAWLGEVFTGQFSLAGTQAKTALLLDGNRWGVPTGSIPTTHILKPGVQGLADQDLDEHLCLDAARRAGLVVAHTRIERFAEFSAIVVERYDRLAVDDRLVRVHQEDLCQALGLPPDRKYQRDGGPTPTQIARLLRNAMSPSVAEEAVRRFADALAWNWVIGGTDAHAKNYSLLLSAGQVRLAPLYDVASALPYGMDEHKLRFAMKVGGSYGVYPRHDYWRAAAEALDLDAEALHARVRELAEVAPDAFSAAAATPDVQALAGDLPARLVDLITDRGRRCLELLDRKAHDPAA
ncbi:MAG TPA: type II toxin-antitoxin system HipA family toxin [Solirubrobacterales bacterium]|jgi:serine/threonine-protein kinase HipA